MSLCMFQRSESLGFLTFTEFAQLYVGPEMYVKWRANTLSACRDDNNFLFFWNNFCLLVLAAEMQAFCSLLHMQRGEVPLNLLVRARFLSFAFKLLRVKIPAFHWNYILVLLLSLT